MSAEYLPGIGFIVSDSAHASFTQSTSFNWRNTFFYWRGTFYVFHTYRWKPKIFTIYSRQNKVSKKFKRSQIRIIWTNMSLLIWVHFHFQIFFFWRLYLLFNLFHPSPSDNIYLLSIAYIDPNLLYPSMFIPVQWPFYICTSILMCLQVI